MCLRNHGVSPLLFDLLAESHAWEVLVYLYYCCNHQRKRGFCTRPQCNQVIGLISFTAVRSRRIYRSPVSEECLSFDELFLFQKHANPPAFTVTGGCVHHRTRRTAAQTAPLVLSVPLLAFSRAELPFGQLPILSVDGDVFPQSAAILRYAGKVGGL